MTTLKVGIAPYEAFKERSMAIARGELKPAADDPKVWFTSMESFAKILSDRNRELLAIIAEMNPSSLTQLAEKTGRAKSNLSRTLKTMERYGLVRVDVGVGRLAAERLEPRANERHARAAADEHDVADVAELEPRVSDGALHAVERALHER